MRTGAETCARNPVSFANEGLFAVELRVTGVSSAALQLSGYTCLSKPANGWRDSLLWYNIDV